MKLILIIPALLLAICSLSANSLVEEQAAACISENGSDQAGLELCLSKLFVPASMDCDELLGVYSIVLKASDGRNDVTVRAVTRVSSKLAIISLAANCYSPDVAARLVARTGSEVSGNSEAIADATVSGAVDAAAALGVDSGSLANSATSGSGDSSSGSGAESAGRTQMAPVQIYYDSEVIVSPSGSNG